MLNVNHHLCGVNQVYKLKELWAQLQQELLVPGQIDALEAEVMAVWLLEHYLSVSRMDLLLNKTVEVPIRVQQVWEETVVRLNRQEPIQYVLGEAYFYGRKFKVTPSVLIPRRETEELVAWVKEGNPKERLRVLDVGTGSGCIAVTLSKEMNQPDVYALDVSEAAVQVAEENAILHQAKVTFLVDDVLQDGLTVPTPFDVIVSNPPYVLRSEASRMSERVLTYEPAQALFVGNEQPLLYYERMIHLCQNEGWLALGGKIYWEINEAMGDKLVQLLRKNQFAELQLRKDMQGKNRFVTGKLVE